MMAKIKDQIRINSLQSEHPDFVLMYAEVTVRYDDTVDNRSLVKGRAEAEEKLKQGLLRTIYGRSSERGPVVWMTGYSGAGKSTIARALEEYLKNLGRPVVVLDGDSLRQGLCANLGFTPENRRENVRRAGEVARLLSESGITCIVATISPYAADREMVRQMIPKEQFLEVFISTSLCECERRDAKGLYAKARAGVLLGFTGVSAPYEAPTNPDLQLNTGYQSTPECVRAIASKIL